MKVLIILFAMLLALTSQGQHSLNSYHSVDMNYCVNVKTNVMHTETEEERLALSSTHIYSNISSDNLKVITYRHWFDLDLQMTHHVYHTELARFNLYVDEIGLPLMLEIQFENKTCMCFEKKRDAMAYRIGNSDKH